MSDTEDGSDDGTDDFDKEAEREKLREQYERDKKRREATQHMSDLLLKGATMTNAHCEECGSPIFRYDGEEFCPTCAGTRDVVDGQGANDQGASGEARDADDAGEAVEGTRGAAQSGGSADRGERSDADRTVGAHGTDAGEDDVDIEAARRRLDERATARSPDFDGPTDVRADAPRTSDSPVRQGEVPSMAQSRASLRRAIVSLSEQAAQSDDPGRAHDLLKGAREAAEALAALEGTTGE